MHENVPSVSLVTLKSWWTLILKINLYQEKDDGIYSHLGEIIKYGHDNMYITIFNNKNAQSFTIQSLEKNKIIKWFSVPKGITNSHLLELLLMM